MKNERQKLQRRAAELLSLLESGTPASAGTRQSVSGETPETFRRETAELFAEFSGENSGMPETAPAARQYTGTERETPAASRRSSDGAAAESAAAAGNGSGFLRGAPDSAPLSGTAEMPLRVQSGTMEDIDRFFRRDSRRYDKCFSEEGEI